MIEIYDAGSVRRFSENVAPKLAEVYGGAFALPPWNEVSRCVSDVCSEDVTAYPVGEPCVSCGAGLGPAYGEEMLAQGWQDMLANEGAIAEVESANGVPVRMTLARPTDVQELFVRKYPDQSQMEGWLINNPLLQERFVWIEDTFANLEASPSGNLRARGQTLSRLALYYGGLNVATRTIQPAVVEATLRDTERTSVFLGTCPLGVDVVRRAVQIGTVPDRRTFLVIAEKEAA